MNMKLMSSIVLFAVTLGLAGICFADAVIGNFEDGNDGWVVNGEAPDGTTIQPFKGNATLGNSSLKLMVPSGWQKAITRDLTEDAKLLIELGKAKQLKIDVTLKAADWGVGTGWVKAIECIVVQSDAGGWQQIDPAGNPEDTAWNGSEDKTVTVTFDVPPQTPPDLTHASIILVTNYDGVEKAGPFYFDKISLVGAAEPNQPKEAAKPAEPNKPAETKKPAEPNKAK
jgi:hypothetical protein